MTNKNTSIIACGQEMDINCRVIRWDEPEGFSFYNKPKGFGSRNISLEDLQKQINMFVFHHSVTYTAKQTFDVLNTRGLSVNFIIDDKGEDNIATIYQCMDLEDYGYSQGIYNKTAIGVEVSYDPQYWKYPNLYTEANQKKYGVQPHPIVNEVIHGQKFTSFGPSEMQVNACIQLAWGICSLLPNVKPVFPRDKNGAIDKNVIKNPEGLTMHLQIDKNKIDPCGFPCERIEKEVGMRLLVGY